jgi:amidohydrolase
MREKALSVQEEVVALRRHFHRFPEASWQEEETAARVEEELKTLGLNPRRLCGTGVVADIEGEGPGPTVALRADMDALQVKEQTDAAYASTREGLMHACGHDGHTAMLLGAAKLLVKEGFTGRVRLIFQPAEEMVQGAKAMIEAGVLEGVDALFGIHLWNDVPVGKINIEPGPRMASGNYVKVTFTGRGGHGSMPDQTVDPVVMAASFLLDSQAILSRERSPLEPATLTFGEVHAGTRFNVIPEEATVIGTYRCFTQDMVDRIREGIERYATGVATAHRGSVQCEIERVTPPLTNDRGFAKVVQSAAVSVVGADNLVSFEKIMGSEDLAYYLEKVPGAIAFVGSGKTDGTSFPHHHPRFDLAEEALVNGTALYASVALTYLKKG